MLATQGSVGTKKREEKCGYERTRAELINSSVGKQRWVFFFLLALN
jgi:hypothetical protein